MEVLKEERKQHRVRMQSLLYIGIDGQVGAKFKRNGADVANKSRTGIKYDKSRMVEVQIREVKQQQAEQLKTAQNNMALQKVRRLQQLLGIGIGSSWVFVMELFGWRQFQNRRELAAAVGLTPTPYNSGDSVREQGISRAGNRRTRKLLIEIAWAWLRFQPNSKLSQWYEQRFAKAGKRSANRHLAMARRLVIDLWRYVESGVVPEGARLKAS
jgi:transposase